MKIKITIAVNVHNEYMAARLSNLLTDGIGFEKTNETSMCKRVLTMDFAEYERATADSLMSIELDGAMSRYLLSYMPKLTKVIQ